MPEIVLKGQKIPYTIRASARARFLRLKISSSGGLEVVIPAGAVVPNLDEILRSRADWIIKHYHPAPTAAAVSAPRRWISGEMLTFLGQPRTLDIAIKPRGKSASIVLDGEVLRLRLPAGADDAATIQTALESWYRAQARDYISRRVAELAAQHGFQYQKVTIKGQSTRWGSCSSQRNLNFNWRLMFAPPAAIDYVIIHELCHLHEMNHSRRFWALVGQYCPDYKQWVKWFKTNGARLQLQ